MNDHRVVTIVCNNDGGHGAIIHTDLDAAKAWARAYLCDPDNEPTPTSEENARYLRDLEGVELLCSPVEAVRGSDAWKEWVYFALLSPEEPSGE